MDKHHEKHSENSKQFNAYCCVLYLMLLLTLPIAIHLFVILLIITRSYIIHPSFIVQIPLYCFLYTLFKLKTRFPTKFALKLARVNSITSIMAKTIGNVSDEIHILTFLAAKKSINCVNQNFDNVDILPLIKSTDIISIGNLAFVENSINCSCVILNIEPVTHIKAFAVNGQRFAMTDVINK